MKPEFKKSYRVLIVDDHPDCAEVTAVLVEIFGHQSCIASTGREALVRAVEFVPEIVILDLGLPDLCGYDVARELRLRVNEPMFIAHSPVGVRRATACVASRPVSMTMF